ncbi:ATP-binding cassette domain-containing protein [Nocardia otitidiscaviarum]|uniref:ABC transporter ATP-binding protein/permease n=1 Tax=Nocardia otitidiscaviarum TaxID=1823 RepID=UPI001894DF2A|nr:ATP-binding cassette domain-containing protein [Nocardia otitidiscaviarum]MBF6132309.1 ATP-binding cassette domain-containing protein [Nocardia otitidiscaviarum]
MIRRPIRSGWLFVTLAVLLVVLLGPVLAPYGPTAAVAPPFQGPSGSHPLGTDVVGRDVLSRVLHGGLPLLSTAGLALVVAYALGLGLGLIAGLRRAVDGWIMRPVDAIVVIPWFLLLAVIATAMGAGPAAIVVTTALASVPWIIRIVRTGTMEVAATGYLESARARGEPLWRLAVVEVLPNLRSVVLADAGVRMSASISMVAVSGFLGLGLRPPSADWALMITENRPGFGMQPWAVLAPALLIMVLVVSVNMVTDRALSSARSVGAWSADVRRAGIRQGGVRGAGVHRAGWRQMGSRDVVPVAGPGLTVAGLDVRDAAGNAVLEDISVHVPAGSGLAVVGPSGAGKTTFALALLGALPDGLTASGAVGLGENGQRRAVGYVPQDPATGLNPALRIGSGLRDIARRHGESDIAASVAAALHRVELPADRAFRRRFPHELSGGQQQRVLLAMALLGDPALLVLDEPTTGLDARTRDRLVDTLLRIRNDRTSTLLVITHDLTSVAPLIDDVLELDAGRSVPPLTHGSVSPPLPPRNGESGFPCDGESATAGGVGGSVSGARCTGAATPVLRVDGLTVGHGRRGGFRPVVEGLSFELRAGECLAVRGRSGAGKTTVARALAGLRAPVRGVVELDGTPLHPRVDRRPPDHRRAIQLIFQNPSASLNPAHRVGAQIARPLRLLHGLDAAAAGQRTRELLAGVGLDAQLRLRRPEHLSGGQQQRAAIARALAAAPRVLICDEITSSLDPSSRDTVLDLLERLRREGLTLIVISHQDAVIDRLADRVLEIPEHGADGGAISPSMVSPETFPLAPSGKYH